MEESIYTKEESLIDDAIKLKFIILGESQVGKTTFLRAFLGEVPKTSYFPTIGIDSIEKELKFQDQKVKVIIWDTAGQERFRTLAPAHFRNVVGCIIAFDPGMKKSFIEVQYWLREMYLHNADQEVAVILISTKADLYSENGTGYQVITDSQIANFAEVNNLKYFKTSAREMFNVKEPIDELVSQIFTKEIHLRKSSLVLEDQRTQLKSNPLPKSSCCKKRKSKKKQLQSDVPINS